MLLHSTQTLRALVSKPLQHLEKHIDGVRGQHHLRGAAVKPCIHSGSVPHDLA
jgi:hypothetical protein